MLVIGATVVTTFNFSAASGARLGSFLEQPRLTQNHGNARSSINFTRMVGLGSVETAEYGAVFVLPKTLHVGEAGAAQPLHLIRDRRPVPVEI
jgi:hypothetical protein